MKKALICLLVLSLWTEPLQAQRAEQRANQAAERAETQPKASTQPADPAQNARLTLLPPPESLTDGDAYPLYQEAANLLPADAVKAIGREWTRMKPGELPLDQVRQVLQRCQTSLGIVEKAALCRSCKWPAVQPGAMPELTGYRDFSRLFLFKADVAMAENRPADAVKAFQTSFAMARHLGTGPGLMPPMVGAAVVGLTCRAVPAYGVLPGAPSLYEALASLPRPFIDVEKQCKAEIDGLDTNPMVNALNRAAFREQLKPAHDRVRQLLKRTDRDLAALQCLEAIRQYTQDHNGALPEKLDQIKVPVPQDILNAKPFEYTCAGSQAVLSSTVPASFNLSADLRYEITATKTDQGVRFTVNSVEGR